MFRIFGDLSLRTKGFLIASIAALALISTALIARNAITELRAELTKAADVTLPQLAEISRTFSLLQTAQLEIVRTSSLVNTGLSGDPMQRQFDIFRNALSRVATAYEHADAAPKGSITAVTRNMKSLSDGDPDIEIIGGDREAQSRKLEASISHVIEQAGAGNFSARVDGRFDTDSMNDIKHGINELMRNIEDGLSTTSDVLQQLASGKLYARFEGDRKGMIADLQQATNSTAGQFQNAILQIHENAPDVNSNSHEMSAAAAELAQRTERTAANLEETSTAIEELTVSVNSSMDVRNGSTKPWPEPSGPPIRARPSFARPWKPCSKSRAFPRKSPRSSALSMTSLSRPTCRP